MTGKKKETNLVQKKKLRHSQWLLYADYARITRGFKTSDTKALANGFSSLYQWDSSYFSQIKRFSDSLRI